ncbi:hypothetical protein [Aquimarina longa]|uniref:hypothetical protein n=1 Tax=Aquimarina longa TaxID=1080221 RepID=UPI000AFA2930|nr:hypothetical protein [Aquimarina longa]
MYIKVARIGFDDVISMVIVDELSFYKNNLSDYVKTGLVDFFKKMTISNLFLRKQYY